MYYNCHTSISIGDKTLQTVISVNTNNDSQQIGADAEIVVPLSCRIAYQSGSYVNGTYKNPNTNFLTDQPKNLFSVGDKVVIKARYDSYQEVTVFEGFVFDFVLGLPVTIKCLDYVYFLRKGLINLKYKTVTFRNLLKDVLKGTGITLMTNTVDFNLYNFTVPYMTPAAVLEYFRKELGINISLMGSNLYVNVASNSIKRIKYQSDVNVLKNELQKPESTFQSFRVKAYFIQSNGKKASFEVGNLSGTLREITFANLSPNQALYEKLAKECYLNCQMQSYRGSIIAPLYPDCSIFDIVEYTDIRFPEKSGDYLITGVGFELSDNGYHRKLKWAHLVNPLPGQITPLLLQ